jgi:hypothetical protein
MTDPRYTDPRDERRTNGRTLFGTTRGDGALWGWIAAIAVLVLIAFVLIAGWNNTNDKTATTTPTAPTTTAPGQNVTPPPASGTTGSGTTSPPPSSPTPANPPAPRQ